MSTGYFSKAEREAAEAKLEAIKADKREAAKVAALEARLALEVAKLQAALREPQISYRHLSRTEAEKKARAKARKVRKRQKLARRRNRR